MRRATKIALGVLAVALALLVLNALTLSNETRKAEVTTEGAEIVETSVGALQVLDEGNRRAPPIALVHCYTCSLHWWDRLAPLLAPRHRVIRVELLGHGGSEKPSAGYGIEEQASAVAEALTELEVENATVVGHSLGGTVATALAARSPRLASRVVIVDSAPDSSYGSLSFSARLGYLPLIGPAINRLSRIAPRSAIKDEYGQAFAPDFGISSGFEDPDQVVEDLRAMTYTAYTDAREASDDYTGEEPLDERLAAAGVPVLIIYGAEDQIFDAEPALTAFENVPGARTALIEEAGHSPNVETPEQVAALILEFAADPGDESAAERPPRDVGKREGGDGGGTAGGDRGGRGGNRPGQ